MRNEWTCGYAAEGGRVDVLQWLRSQDPPCPWDKRIRTGALCSCAACWASPSDWRAELVIL